MEKITLPKSIQNPVQIDNILKEQVFTEEQTKLFWEKKWNFTKDFYKYYHEETINEDLTLIEEKLLIGKNSKEFNKNDLIIKNQSCGPVPVTTSGMIGWRCCNEKFKNLNCMFNNNKLKRNEEHNISIKLG